MKDKSIKVYECERCGRKWNYMFYEEQIINYVNKQRVFWLDFIRFIQGKCISDDKEICACGFPQSSPEPHEHSKELSLQKTSEEIANRLIEAKTKGNWIESPVRIMKWLPADKVD